MKKVGICCLNSKYIHSSLAPWYLKAGVGKYSSLSHDVEVLEGTINQSEEALLEMLLSGGYDAIGFCCYIWNIQMVQRLVERLTIQAPDIILMLGGPEVSYRPEELLNQLPGVSYILVGEGEKPLAELLDRLASGGDTDGVPGLCYRKGETLVCQPPYLLQEEPPSPYSNEYLDRLEGRIAYLETSRGCPFSCSFCLSGGCRGVRSFSLERAKRELLLLANAGTRTVKLVDRTFNCNPHRADELMRFLMEQAKSGAIPENVCFHFEVGADLFSEESLALIASAPPGLFQFEAGLQSFQEKTLLAVNRKTDMERLTANLSKMIRAGNAHVHIDLIAGLPYEGMESFQESFQKAYWLKPHMLQLGFLKMLYGSQIREEAETYHYRFSPHPPYEFLSNDFMTEGEAEMIHTVEDALERLYNSGRFLLTLDYLLETLTLTPFSLFYLFGSYVEGQVDVHGISLDAYTELLYTFFSGKEGIDPQKLRDVLVCDRLASINTGKLPSCLRIEDKRLKKLRNRLSGSGNRFGVAILYSGKEKIVTADYQKKDAITGRYALKLQEMSDWHENIY